ncbi:SET domain-containing protein 5 [Madurella fahalii]|uniref:SET domain-containing protein 5 n=1 Tax=Madurella fahalii TaxID=1157608 RepID=A0ABQ0GIT4_9PEZI
MFPRPHIVYKAPSLLALGLLFHAGQVSADTSTLGHCLWDPLGPLGNEKYAYASGDLKCTKLIDDSSSSWAPWDYPPKCARPENGGPSGYCVYTKASLHGNSGLSILSTPEIAAGLAANLEDFDPAWLHPQARFYYQLTGDNPQSYEVRDVPGKGKGAVATRAIRAGEIIQREAPVILTVAQLPKGIVPSQVAGMFDVAFQQLPDQERQRVMAMAKSAGTDHFLDDILHTNGIGITMDGYALSGLYPEISRMNHACRPNVFTRYSVRTMILEAVAYVDIQPGEELSLSYLPLNLLSQDRKKMIQRWHFNCTCSICSSKEKTDLSDQNRLRIQAILDEFKRQKNRNRGNVEPLEKELWALVERERLEAQAGSFASIFAGIYFQMQNLDKAREYASQAVQNHTYYSGYDSDKTKSALEMLDFLQSIELEYN